MTDSTAAQPFVFPATAQHVRVVLIDGEPWFVSADVCAVLDLGNPRSSTARLDEDEKGVHAVDTLGGRQNVAIVNESGLYSLMLRSRKPEATAFKRWVTHDLLPALRRGELTRTVDISSITRRDLAVMLIEAEDARLLAEAAALEMAPKAEAFDAFMEADGTYSMGEVANLLGLGRTTLFRRLRELGVLQRDNRPYQRYAQHFKVVAGSHDRNGTEVPHFTTYVQPTGVELVRRKLFPPGSQLTLVAT